MTKKQPLIQKSSATKPRFPKSKQDAIDLYLQGRLKLPDGRFYLGHFFRRNPKALGFLSLLSPVWGLGLVANLSGKLIKPYLPGHKPSRLSDTTRALSYYLMKFHDEKGSIEESSVAEKDRLAVTSRTYQALQAEILHRARAIQENRCNRVGHFISNHHNRDKILKGFNIISTKTDKGFTYHLKNDKKLGEEKISEASKEAIHYSLGKVKFGALQIIYYLGKILASLAALATFIALFSSLSPVLGGLAAPAAVGITLATIIGLFAAGSQFGKYNTLISNSFCALIFFRDFRYLDPKTGLYKKMGAKQVTATSIFVPIAITSATVTAIMTYSSLHSVLLVGLAGLGASAPPIAAILAAGVGICVAGLIIHSGLKVIQQKSFGIKKAMQNFCDKIKEKGQISFETQQLNIIYIVCLIPAVALLIMGVVFDSFNIFQQLPSSVLAVLPSKLVEYLSTSAHNLAAIPLLIEGATKIATVMSIATTKLLEATPLKDLKNPILLAAATVIAIPFALTSIAIKAVYKISHAITFAPLKIVQWIRGKITMEKINPLEDASAYTHHQLSTDISQSTKEILNYDSHTPIASDVAITSMIFDLNAVDSDAEASDINTYGDTPLISCS